MIRREVRREAGSEPRGKVSMDIYKVKLHYFDFISHYSYFFFQGELTVCILTKSDLGWKFKCKTSNFAD
jgi:hypothetical protein